MILSDHNDYKRDITEVKVKSWCACLPKLNSAEQPPATTSCFEMDVKTTIIYISFSTGIISCTFRPLSPLLFSESSVSWQIKGIRYHLDFFSKWIHMWHIWVQDWLITHFFLCSLLCSHGNCCMFGRKLLKAVEKERERDRQRRRERA